MNEVDDTHENSELLSLLGDFGLTRQEGAVYLSLLSEGSMNGYEISKATGISRSNAYTSLASLVDKGAAWIIDGSPTRYTAVAVAEFTENRIRALSRSRERVLAGLPTVRDHAGGYITIKGRDHILDKLRHIIIDAEERVYLACDAALVARFAQELAAVAASGKKLVIVTAKEAVGAEPLSRICAAGSLEGAESRVQAHSGSIVPGHVRAIADSRYALTGDISDGDAASCLFSDERNFVELFKNALKNEIRLAGIDAREGRVSDERPSADESPASARGDTLRGR